VELTDLQLSILRVLWERGESSVSAVQQALATERPLAVTTVATMLTRLERRGVVAHRALGRQFAYRATVSEREVRRSMVSRLTDALFGGSPAALVSHLLGSRDIESDDLAAVKRLIADAERRAAADGDA
jgi:predicted transcriptional regulator